MSCSQPRGTLTTRTRFRSRVTQVCSSGMLALGSALVSVVHCLRLLTRTLPLQTCKVHRKRAQPVRPRCQLQPEQAEVWALLFSAVVYVCVVSSFPS